MEEVTFIRASSLSVSNTARPSPGPSLAPKSGGSERSGNQTARTSEAGVASASSAGGTPPKTSLADVNAAVDDINRRLEVARHSLRFQIDDDTNEIKVQVVDKETGKVIRVIPPEPSLSLLANGDLSGLFSVQA